MEIYSIIYYKMNKKEFRRKLTDLTHDIHLAVVYDDINTIKLKQIELNKLINEYEIKDDDIWYGEID